jgi:hypothetical protein
MLSVEAFQVRSICDEETAVAARPVGTVGATLSIPTPGIVAVASNDMGEPTTFGTLARTVCVPMVVPSVQVTDE